MRSKRLTSSASNNVRRIVVFFAALAVLLVPRFAAAAQEVPIVTITAQQIALFADRSVLIADSGVSIRIQGVDAIDATRAAYDLRTNVLTADTSAGPLTYDFNKRTLAHPAHASVPQYNINDAFAIGQQVELRPGETIAFSNAQVRAGSTFVPAAAYTFTIPPPNAKDFGYSPVPAAAIDYGFLLGSSRNAYEFTRFRYDKYNGGLGAGLEEHFAPTDRGYAAFGQTLDINGGRLDMALYQRMNDTYSQSLSGSYLAGTHTARYAITAGGKRGYALFSIFQYNNFRTDDVLVSGNQHPFARFLSLRLQADLAHDVHPGDWHVPQDYRLTPLIHADTVPAHLGALSLSASGDLGEAFYNYGRATLASDMTLWSSLPVNRRLQFTGGATFSHNAPPFPATFRTYTLGNVWRASDAFNLVTSVNYTHDFGQIFGYGRPQWTAALDVTFRRRNHTGIEIGAVEPFGGVGSMYRQSGFNIRFFKW